MKRRIGHVMLVGWLALTAGCLMPRTESRPVHTYQLTNPDVDSVTVEARQPDRTGPILLVSLPQSDPGFDTQRMAYLTKPYEVNYFADNQWVDTPGRMLGPLVVKALERSGAWRAVVTAPSVLRADYRLDLNGVVLVQEFVRTPSRARLSWNAQLTDLRGGLPVGTRRFDASQDTVTDDAYGGVRAANQLLGKLLDETVSWLAACVAGPGKAAC